MLTKIDKEILIGIVRESVKRALSGTDFVPDTPDSAALLENCGCFVTLKTEGNLRGCLGCFISNEPLYLGVARMSRDSALNDPRFAANRLSIADFDRITFDISVLSPLERCSAPEDITLGKHGIYLKNGWQSGCFLPQVATETGWTVEQFWSNCCSHKAGLPPEAWKNGDIELYTFTAEVIESTCKAGE